MTDFFPEEEKFARERIKKEETIRDGRDMSRPGNGKTELEVLCALREFSAHVRNISRRAFVLAFSQERDRRAFQY